MPSVASSAVTLLLFCGATLHVAAGERPNLVFLLSDDQTVGAVGCYGNADVLTPHLDRLAREGMRFLNHYDTTSICMASRASLMTGLYEYRHGCNFDRGPLERRLFDDSYPVRLRRAGYFTGFAGKLGFVIEGEPFAALERDFDAWAGGRGQTHYETAKNPGIARYADRYPHCSRAYGEWARDFLRAAKRRDAPFCLSISFKAPHLPATPDPADLQLYEAKKSFTRPLNFGTANGRHLSAQARASRAATAYREWVDRYDETVRNYYARVTGVDAAVGMIREELERLELARNTVIVFTSDNGYNCGAHGFGDKVLPYEEGSKAPLIIYDPRLSARHAGRTCEAVTANVDLPPTLCELAGVPLPEGVDGKSLAPLLTDPDGKVRDWLPLFNFWGAAAAQSMAVVSNRWKYVYWYYGEGMRPSEELFHLLDDRLEMKNTANDARHRAELAAARRAYDAELNAIEVRVRQGRGYAPYAVLFDRETPWEKKKPLLTLARGSGDGDADGVEPKSKKRDERRSPPGDSR